MTRLGNRLAKVEQRAAITHPKPNVVTEEWLQYCASIGVGRNLDHESEVGTLRMENWWPRISNAELEKLGEAFDHLAAEEKIGDR